MPDSDKPAPNQTIQLEALDASEAERLTAGPGSSGPSAPPPSEAMPSRRKTPPPLPPSALMSNPPPVEPDLHAPAPYTSRAPSAPPPAPRSPAQRVALIAVFAVVVAGAIAGGLAVGSNARTRLAPVASATAGGPAASAAPAASASDNVLMLPTIEMSSQPSSSGSGN